jgi:predicted Ser/Thr protein kinase
MLKAGLATQTEGPHGTKVLQPPPAPAEIAALFPQLEILECLGRGGMGVVYKARQPRLNRLVALKILAREKEQDVQFAERFTREAQALARLNHPNIVTVYDFGTVGQASSLPPSEKAQAKSETGATPVLHYLLMEFVDGLNLRQLLQTGTMHPKQALTIVPKICEALQYAHEQGIVHRDIKPENILLDKSGRVKIADFGIAKMMGDGRDALLRVQADQQVGPTHLTEAGHVIGTPHYMAPEQIEKPLSVDHRADIYSLGVVFYEMLTGELPLGKFQPPSAKVQIDVRLDEVVLHALEKEPARRYQQVSQVKTAVETIVTTPSGVSPAEQITAAQIEAVRNRLKIPARGLIAAGGLQALAALGLLVFAIPAITSEGGDPMGYAAIGFGATLLLVVAGIVLRGATSLRKLQYYRFSVGASVVAAVTGPGALLGLPFGVWACVELFRPEVRAAFAANRAPTGSSATPDSRKMDFARSQVKGPAIGLVVTGVFNWVAVTFFLLFFKLKPVVLLGPATAVNATAVFPMVALLTMVLSGFIIYTGLKIMRLEQHAAGITGGVLAMIVAPASIIGLPVGIWALVVLNRREVRAAFEANQHDRNLTRRQPTLFGPAWKFAAFIFVLILSYELSRTVFSHLIAGRSHPVKSDYIGQAWFPQGDSIEIISVDRTTNQMTVKGRYNLVSHDKADLALYITVTNKNVTEGSGEARPISKGRGDFTLVYLLPVASLPHVSMYANGHPFASLYFGTKAEAQEENRAGWITNSPSASAEIWSPTLAPGKKPDLQKIRDEVETLMKQGHYEEALQRQIWYFNHALEYGEVNPVRLSFGITDWAELGRRYPKAKEALVEIRDRDTQKLIEGSGNSDLFSEVDAINSRLNQDDATYTLFKSLDMKNPELAQPCYFYAEDLLVQKGEYQLCQKYMGRPQFRFSLIQEEWESDRDAQKRAASTRTRESKALQMEANNRFVGQTCRLIEILVGTGQKTAAEKIRDQAVAVLDDPRLKSAVSDAEEKIQKRAAADSKSQTQDAVSAAKEWLTVVDAGNYSGSWKGAAPFFQGAVTETSWETSMISFRKPLGSLISRKLKSAQLMTEMPGAPDGQYVVMQFETSFANTKSAIETVTFARDQDGQWRAAGYYIK